MSKAKKPMVKCPGCEKRFYREDESYIHLKNRYWHEDCYNSIKAKEEKLERDKNKLNEYICNLFGTTYVSPRIQKQVNYYIKNYDYTHSGILGSLVYWFDVKGESIAKANGGIGIVPFIYEDASKYFSSISAAHEANEGINLEETEEITIVIPTPKRKRKIVEEIDLDYFERTD